MDQYLTASQIYITEENIVKYDKILICEVGVPEDLHTIKYEDLKLLADKTRSKIEEILEGVGLR